MKLQYFSYFLLALLSILVLIPRVSLIIYRMLLAVEIRVSGRNCLPVIIQGREHLEGLHKRKYP